jgi:hypothetical protein
MEQHGAQKRDAQYSSGGLRLYDRAGDSQNGGEDREQNRVVVNNGLASPEINDGATDCRRNCCEPHSTAAREENASAQSEGHQRGKARNRFQRFAVAPPRGNTEKHNRQEEQDGRQHIEKVAGGLSSFPSAL